MVCSKIGGQSRINRFHMFITRNKSMLYTIKVDKRNIYIHTFALLATSQCNKICVAIETDSVDKTVIIYILILAL